MSQSSAKTELIDYIHPSLSSSFDYSTRSAKIAMVTSAAMTSLLLFGSSHLIYRRLTSFYRRLPVKHQVFANLSVVRAAFGLFCIAVGLWAFFADTALEDDIVFSTCPTGFAAISVTVGFFVFESVAVSWYDIYFNTFSHLTHLHHWMTLIGFSVVLLKDMGHSVCCKGLLLEMVMPFSAVRWMLLKAGKEHSLAKRVNQFVLVKAFHLRNVVEMAIWYITYKHWNYVWTHTPLVILVPLCLQLLVLTFCLTPYWTLRKTRQLICPVDWNFEKTKPVSSRNVQLNVLDRGLHLDNSNDFHLAKIVTNGVAGSGPVKEE